MQKSLATHDVGGKVHKRILLWLYPRLRELPTQSWPGALDRARDTAFDTGELVGIVGGACLIAWLLGMETPAHAIEPRLVAHVLQFFIALPLLAMVVGPWYLRRTRRGLARELTRGALHAGDAHARTEQEDT